MEKCTFCNDIKTHQEELNTLLTYVKKERKSLLRAEPNKSSNFFARRNFGKVSDAGSDKKVNLCYLEKKFNSNYPDWKATVQCSPKGIDYIDQGVYEWAIKLKQWLNTTKQWLDNHDTSHNDYDKTHKDYERRNKYRKTS